MLAYHNDQKVKRKYLARVRAHRAADEIVQGYGYWNDGKGCAVGCTIHGSSHKSYESEIGYPEELAHLEDWLFERLPKKIAREWPLRFLKAAKTGADLSRVYDLWSAWNLIDPIDGVINLVSDDFPDVQKVVRETGAACLDGTRVNSARAARAARAAWAAGAAGAAGAAWAAWVAWVARVAGAARAAGAAGAAEVAGVAGAAGAAYYIRAADKLIELIESAT